MSNAQKALDDQKLTNNLQSTEQPSPSAVGWIEHHYRRLKENAETYPYVWASYGVVYIGFGLWTTYRWRKLRRTEDRVRVLQARLHELVEAEESAVSKAVPDRVATSTTIPDKTASSTIGEAQESALPATVTAKPAI